MEKIKIAITAGDPAGIGYEIACKYIISDNAHNFDITLIAHNFIVEKTFSEIIKVKQPSNLKIIEPENNKPFNFVYGKHDNNCGRAAMNYIETAVNRINNGEFDAVVTCPINKKSIRDAGFNFPGHTEYLAFLSDAKNVSMLLAGNKVKTILATTHYPISMVSSTLTVEKVYNSIKNAFQAGRYFGNKNPKIAVCGLNPHAGDAGSIGNEEEFIIKPAIEKSNAEGFNAEGPFPADTIFTGAEQWDFIIAMYHDQGMIPVKMDAFGEAVNVTLNLPFIRTSVDHGTAFDIAGKGIASCSSLIKAVNLANSMAIYDKSTKNI